MADKKMRIEQESRNIVRSLQSILPASPEEITNAMRQCMDAKQLQMFDLAHFCEQETIRAQEAKAHFAACLMGAAMNEALLALMCLKYEPDVVATSQFKYSTRKKPRPLRDVIADWSFEQFIKVAEEREWIPAGIVSQEIKTALAGGFRELMPITHPEMTEEAITRGAESFFVYPGTAMLRMTQELRNAIHAGKWMRSKNTFVAEHFTEWCHFATILSGEIRLCLLHLMVERDSKVANDKMLALTKMLDGLSPECRLIFEEQVRAKLKLGIDEEIP
jgi:hypothetical protein